MISEKVVPPSPLHKNPRKWKKWNCCLSRVDDHPHSARGELEAWPPVEGPASFLQWKNSPSLLLLLLLRQLLWFAYLSYYTLPAEITIAFLGRVLPFWFLEQSSPQSWEFLVRADELVLAICVLIYLRSSFITCHLDPGSFCRLLFWYLCLAHWLPVVAGILVPQFWGPTCNQTAFLSSVFQFPFHQQPCLGLCIRTHEGHGGRCCLDKCLSILPSAITRTALQGNEKRDLG